MYKLKYYNKAIDEVSKALSDKVYASYMSGSNNYWHCIDLNSVALCLYILYDRKLEQKYILQDLEEQIKKEFNKLKNKA